MQASHSIFFEFEFLALIVFSFVLPIGIYAYMMWMKAISRVTVSILGCTLIAISGVDLYLLQRLATLSKNSPSLIDDGMFSSEISIALYLLPVLFTGVGVSIISHVLINHLTEAEQRYDRTHSASQS